MILRDHWNSTLTQVQTALLKRTMGKERDKSPGLRADDEIILFANPICFFFSPIPNILPAIPGSVLPIRSFAHPFVPYPVSLVAEKFPSLIIAYHHREGY